ncbi:10225_t:CDS:2 [Gigaspora rosea]|nr:10225_t:CDS:2 [Gigaspora rosea]
MQMALILLKLNWKSSAHIMEESMQYMPTLLENFGLDNEDYNELFDENGANNTENSVDDTENGANDTENGADNTENGIESTKRNINAINILYLYIIEDNIQNKKTSLSF